jgi:ubiquinone biosynthesis protein
MFSTVKNAWRLLRAGQTLARYNFFMQASQVAELPWLARTGLLIARFGAASPSENTQSQIIAALSALGPSYIKLGQFLATRPDIIGVKRAFELRALQDKLPPFGMAEARSAVSNNLGKDVGQLFAEFGEPVAAASIAQVHKARTTEGTDVAVKILRPGIEKRFSDDLKSFAFAARLMEFFSAEARRLRPVAAVDMLEHSMKLELDLRLEASAISEMTQNTENETDFRLPKVDWARTSRQILTTEWIDGTPLSDIAALRAKGFDLKALADTLIQSFLRHAIRDGFFHADMHQGNLFVGCG